VKLRVVIADDHPLVINAMAHVLDEASDFEVVGTATAGAQVLPLVARTNPDLVLLDLQMPIVDGLGCLAMLRERHPTVRVVVLSGSDDPDAIQQALGLGAAAYVSKSIDPHEMPCILRQAVAENVYYATPRIDRESVGQIQSERRERQVREQTGLTARELEILAAVSSGLSNRAVGKQLFLSDQTVKFHLHKIYGKLGVRNRTEASGVARRLGLVHDLAAAG
jgi:DNA-binding NarL/FixJ family response regulator